MSSEITWEAELFLTAIGLGGRMMLIYDVLRIYRYLVPHCRLARDAEDILYWIYCALWAFAVAFKENDGSIRWFYLAGIAIGMILWTVIFSKPLKKTVTWVKMRWSKRRYDGEQASRQ